VKGSKLPFARRSECHSEVAGDRFNWDEEEEVEDDELIRR